MYDLSVVFIKICINIHMPIAILSISTGPNVVRRHQHMNIYPSTKVRPYVYFGFSPITEEFYIGYREANTKPSHIDLFEYKTSSKTVRLIFDRMIWTILAEFENGDDAFDFEQNLIAEHWENPLLLNEQYRLPSGNIRFRTTGNAPAKNAITRERLGMVSIDDFRWKTGEIVGVNTGLKLGPYSPERIENMRSAMIGSHTSQRTAEHNKNISKALKGKTPKASSIATTAEKNRKTIICNGEQFNSLTDASSVLGIPIPTISYRLHSNSFTEWYFV